jgi:regulator of protease activity HflC (stomatin/prohibitin superfamily)
LSEVPIDNRDMPMMFHARTADFQDAAIQATVSFRIADPSLAVKRVDFSISPHTGGWQADPLDKLAQLVVETAQSHALAVVAGLSLSDALATGIGATRDAVAKGLAADARIRDTGLEVIGVRVLAMTPEAEMDRALQTPTREAVQQNADKATYERRALAVERERAISQNELQSRIELAVREKELLVQEGENSRKRAEDEAAARAIADDASAQSVRVLGSARADAAKALVDAHAKANPTVMLAQAAETAAERLGNVTSLTITPDLLAQFLGTRGKAE